MVGIPDFRLDRQHLVNSVCGCRSAREHDEHHRDHQQCEQNQHSILQESDQRSHLHLSIIDADSAEPENSNAGKVQAQHHNRHERRYHPVHFDGNIGQIQVGLVKAVLLVLLTIKRPHYAHPGQTFIQDEIELIQFRLHDAEQRNGPAHKEHDSAHKDWNDHQ